MGAPPGLSWAAVRARSWALPSKGPPLSVGHASQLAARHFPSVLQGGGAAGALPGVPS